MRYIDLDTLPNGAHNNQNGGACPEGWAVIPEEMVLENFPFGTATAETIDGVLTLTEWIPGEMPPEPEPEPSAEDDIEMMLVDHEYRLTLLELGVLE